MDRARENRRLSRRLAVVAVGMFGFGFALVPFYNQICAALGINSLQQPDVVNTQVDRSRTVTIEFDSNATRPGRSDRSAGFVRSISNPHLGANGSVRWRDRKPVHSGRRERPSV